jgi:sigma-E factor negative regulatory protein RseB
VLVFSAPGMLSSSRVAHFVAADKAWERMETLDGRAQHIYRANDVVHTLWPQSHVASIERRGAMSRLPSSTQSVEPRALERYELRVESVERIAGREAQVLLLKPRDALRYAQRLWADFETGLMLRNDVIGLTGQVLESTAFSEIEIGIRAQPETVTQPMQRLAGYRVVRPAERATQLEDEGWTMARPVAGFRSAGCVKRTLERPDAAAATQVLQAVYTDGLTHVSVFVEAEGGREPKPLDGASFGATGALRVKRNDHTITVMGDVPPVTLQAFADAIDRRH